MATKQLSKHNRPGIREKWEQEEIVTRCFLEKLGVEIETTRGSDPPDRVMLFEGKHISIEVTSLTNTVKKANNNAIDKECFA